MKNIRPFRTLVAIAACLFVAAGAFAAAQQEAGSTVTGQVAPGPWGKYDPAIDITTVGTPVNPNYLGEGNSDADNPWTRAYRDVLGINLSYQWLSDEYDSRVNLMIASGDLPDFFRVNVVQFQQLVDAGLVADMTSAYKDYASADTRMVIEQEGGPTPIAACTFDGKMLAVPWTYLHEGVPMLWVRTDWLEALGADVPKTMQDVFDLSRAFTHDDPDGNGEDDTIGLFMSKALFDAWGLGFFNSFHAYPKAWITDSNGRLVYGSVQPEMRDALEQLQAMYADGQLDAEFIVKDGNKALEMIASGKCGLHYGEFHSVRQPARDNDPNTEFTAIPIPSVNTNDAKAQVADLVYSYWVVKKGYENPEAPIKMMNMWMEYFYFTNDDEIYKTYNQGKAGAGMWQASAIKAYRGYKNVANAKAVNGVLDGTMTLEDLNPEQRGVFSKVNDYLQNGNEAQWRYTKIFGPDASMLVVDHYRQNNLFQENMYYASATETMTRVWSTLEDRIAEAAVNIITGAPIETFDTMVAEWKRLGGDQVTQEVNEWYAGR